VRVTLTLEPAILEAVDRVSREQAISRSEAANRLLSGGLWDVDLAGAVDLSSSAVDL
jgi:metal-responsive CopG/Arc/MetJ family transcriptional regulator